MAGPVRGAARAEQGDPAGSPPGRLLCRSAPPRPARRPISARPRPPPASEPIGARSRSAGPSPPVPGLPGERGGPSRLTGTNQRCPRPRPRRTGGPGGAARADRLLTCPRGSGSRTGRGLSVRRAGSPGGAGQSGQRAAGPARPAQRSGASAAAAPGAAWDAGRPWRGGGCRWWTCRTTTSRSCGLPWCWRCAPPPSSPWIR